MPIETHYISHDIITNDKVWPNPIVVKLTNVEFVK